MFTLEDAAAAVVAIGLIMYALFAGADFGGGIWTLFASGPREKEQQESLFHAIGPVWETNHIWLILVVVVLFNAFPRAFAALFIALLIPLVIALVGINFRGAAFAFRHFGRYASHDVPFIARTFEISSILTPCALGMAVTATATGRIGMVNGEVTGGLWAWLSPFTILGGIVGAGVCAYLAPIYMTVRTRGELREDFRRRGMLAGVLLGTITALEIPVALADAPLFAQRLLHGPALYLVALAVATGCATELLLWKRYFIAGQLAAAVTVAATIAGFCLAMYPDLIIGQVSIHEAAAPRATLIAFFTVLPFGALVLVPSLLFLYWTFRGEPNPHLKP